MSLATRQAWRRSTCRSSTDGSRLGPLLGTHTARQWNWLTVGSHRQQLRRCGRSPSGPQNHGSGCSPTRNVRPQDVRHGVPPLGMAFGCHRRIMRSSCDCRHRDIPPRSPWIAESGPRIALGPACRLPGACVATHGYGIDRASVANVNTATATVVGLHRTDRGTMGDRTARGVKRLTTT